MRRRVAWTRFDADDEKTWPAYGRSVIVYADDAGYSIDHITHEWTDGKPPAPVWWHPLPNPPG
jgi:hypothetical protein